MKSIFLALIFFVQSAWATPTVCNQVPSVARNARDMCLIATNVPECASIPSDKKINCNQLSTGLGTAAFMAREAVVDPISCLMGVGVALSGLWDMIKAVFKFITNPDYARQQLQTIDSVARAGFSILTNYLSTEYNRQLIRHRNYISPLKEVMAMEAMRSQIVNMLMDKVLQLVKNSTAHYSCLNKNERDRLVCQVAATILIPPGAAVLGRLFVRGTAALIPRVSAAISRATAPLRVARAAVSLDRVVGNKVVLYSLTGERLPLSRIQPGESFQAVLLRDGETIALIEPGVRNGGHQRLAQVATRNDPYPAFEPSDLPAAGNIRFVVDSRGRWQTQVGGRYYTSDHPIGANDLAQALQRSGAPPVMVTPGRLPGWERPAN